MWKSRLKAFRSAVASVGGARLHFFLWCLARAEWLWFAGFLLGECALPPSPLLWLRECRLWTQCFLSFGWLGVQSYSVLQLKALLHEPPRKPHIVPLTPGWCLTSLSTFSGLPVCLGFPVAVCGQNREKNHICSVFLEMWVYMAVFWLPERKITFNDVSLSCFVLRFDYFNFPGDHLELYSFVQLLLFS